jgi:hypothetical protein
MDAKGYERVVGAVGQHGADVFPVLRVGDTAYDQAVSDLTAATDAYVAAGDLDDAAAAPIEAAYVTAQRGVVSEFVTLEVPATVRPHVVLGALGKAGLFQSSSRPRLVDPIPTPTTEPGRYALTFTDAAYSPNPTMRGV